MNTTEWIAQLEGPKDSPLRSRLKKAIEPSPDFSVLDVAVNGLIERLRHPGSSKGGYLWKKLGHGLRSRITESLHSDAEELSDPLSHALVADLNRIVAGPLLWMEQAFADVDLRKSTRYLCQNAMDQGAVSKANRALIEDAFPDCFLLPGHYTLLPEYQAAEKEELKKLAAEIIQSWERLLLEPKFQETLEQKKPKATAEYCLKHYGIRLPGEFEIRTWCEMRAKTPHGKKLLALLAQYKHLAPTHPQTIQNVSADKPLLKWQQHFVRRELRQGRVGALFLGYFELTRISRVALMKQFGFGQEALLALKEIGTKIAADAERLLEDEGQSAPAIKKGRGRPGDQIAHDLARQYFDLAMDYPRAKARELIKKTGKKFSPTEESRANAMINLAAATRRHLQGV